MKVMSLVWSHFLSILLPSFTHVQCLTITTVNSEFHKLCLSHLITNIYLLAKTFEGSATSPMSKSVDIQELLIWHSTHQLKKKAWSATFKCKLRGPLKECMLCIQDYTVMKVLFFFLIGKSEHSLLKMAPGVTYTLDKDCWNTASTLQMKSWLK